MGASFPTTGRFKTAIVPGTISAAGDEVQVTLTSTQTGNACRNVNGAFGCFTDVDPSIPIVNLTAKLQTNPIWGRPFWYLQSDFSIADAHEDEPRDGLLNLFFDSASDRQSVDVYLVSAP